MTTAIATYYSTENSSPCFRDVPPLNNLHNIHAVICTLFSSGFSVTAKISTKKVKVFENNYLPYQILIIATVLQAKTAKLFRRG